MSNVTFSIVKREDRPTDVVGVLDSFRYRALTPHTPTECENHLHAVSGREWRVTVIDVPIPGTKRMGKGLSAELLEEDR